jgi:hypothetical protein
MYLQKFAKNGNLIRTAERFGSNWVVHVYSGLNISGEYTEDEFKQIRKFF